MGALSDALVNAGMKVAQAVIIERGITNSGTKPGTEEFKAALMASGVDQHTATALSAALLSSVSGDGASRVGRVRSLMHIARQSSTQMDIVSRAGGKLWLRTMRYNVFTATASAGVASQMWRVTRLIRLLGAAIVPTQTPSSVGGWTTAARVLHPFTADGGQIAASGTVYGTFSQGDAISWAVTVPASGIVQVLLATTGTSQTYSVTCGGQTATGTLAASTSSGIMPAVVTLYGCTAGAQTLTVTKTQSGGGLYSAGLCFAAPDRADFSDGTMLSWFDAAAKLIDGDGANDIAIFAGSQFSGSYHGGQYAAANTWLLDGVSVDVLSGAAVRACNSIINRHDGRISTMATQIEQSVMPDGHIVSGWLAGSALVTTDIHVAMAGCSAAMSQVNGAEVPQNSTLTPLSTATDITVSTPARDRAVRMTLDYCRVDGVDAPVITQAVHTGPSGYCKAYGTTQGRTLGRLEWQTTHSYT